MTTAMTLHDQLVKQFGWGSLQQACKITRSVCIFILSITRKERKQYTAWKQVKRETYMAVSKRQKHCIYHKVNWTKDRGDKGNSTSASQGAEPRQGNSLVRLKQWSVRHVRIWVWVSPMVSYHSICLSDPIPLDQRKKKSFKEDNCT